MAEVGDRLVGQFAQCLSERLAEPAGAVADQPADTEPLDLFRTAGMPVAKRAALGVGAVVLVAVVVLGLRRRRH